MLSSILAKQFFTTCCLMVFLPKSAIVDNIKNKKAETSPLPFDNEIMSSSMKT